MLSNITNKRLKHESLFLSALYMIYNVLLNLNVNLSRPEQLALSKDTVAANRLEANRLAANRLEANRRSIRLDSSLKLYDISL